MAERDPVLVVGATGRLGTLITAELLARGRRVRAVVRADSDKERVAHLRELGAETVGADLREAETLDGACRGCSAVISSATGVTGESEDTIAATDLAGHLALIAAARKSAVRRFVYISFSRNVEPVEPSPLTEAKRTVERELQQGDLGYTILRSGPFMEVWLAPAAGFDYPNSRATLFGSGERPLSWVSMRDLASMAASAIDSAAARGAVLEVGGPQALSALEVVRVFEELTGRRFEVQHIPEQELEARKASARDPQSRSISSLLLQLARGDAIDMRHTLSVIPVELTSVREYAGGVLG